MQLLQNFIILILRPTEIFTKISKKKRQLVVSLCCVLLVCFFIAYFTPSFKIRNRLTYDQVIGSAILFVLILFSRDGALRKVVWNKIIAYTTVFAGLGILLISFLHPIGSGYRAFAMMLIFGFPCLYYVWNVREDYNALYKRLSAATAIVGVLYYCYCFMLANQGRLEMTLGATWSRVKGSFYDANMFSMIGMIMFCAALYMILVNRESVGWFLLSALSIGAGISIMRMGVSRLAILVAIGGIVAFVIYYLKIQRFFTEGRRAGTKVARALATISVVIIFISLGNYMVELNHKVITNHQVNNHETNEIDSDENQKVKDDIQEITAAQEQLGLADRFQSKGIDLNTYTAGRYGVWLGYAKYLNLTGNDFSKVDWTVLTNNTVKHAHNNFLEIAYRCGVPVACIHLFLELAAGIICLIWLFSPKYKDPAYLFCIVFMICYTVQSLFDIATLPFERPAPFYFYMAMIPMFTFGTDKDRKSEGKHYA